MVTELDKRASVLRRAITLTAEDAGSMLEEIFAEDVNVWSPGTTVSSRAELAAELRARDQVFTDIAFAIRSVDIVGDRGYAEWVVSAVHGEALVVDDDTVVEATGQPVTAGGITVATFDGDQIVELRQYWDEAGLLAGLGLVPTDD